MNTEDLKTLIENSFPKLDSESRFFLPDGVTDDQMRELRNDICKFYAEDIPPYLGVVLFYSLCNVPSNKAEGESYERFFYFLDANTSAPFIAGENLGRDKKEIQAELDLRRRRQKDFEILSANQVKAVKHWLSVAKLWQGLELFINDVEDAIKYWSQVENEKHAGS